MRRNPGCSSYLSGERNTVRVRVATRPPAAIIPTLVAITLAALATGIYNYLQTRLDLLQAEMFGVERRTRHFRGTQKFSLTKRFSQLPAVGLLATTGLAVAVMAYMLLISTLHRPMGLYVKLPAHTSPSECANSDVVVVELLRDGTLRVNSERVVLENLSERFREIFRPRTERVLFVRADPEVDFQDVATVIGLAEDAVPDLRVVLLTPGAQEEACAYFTRP